MKFRLLQIEMAVSGFFLFVFLLLFLNYFTLKITVLYLPHVLVVLLAVLFLLKKMLLMRVNMAGIYLCFGIKGRDFAVLKYVSFENKILLEFGENYCKITDTSNDQEIQFVDFLTMNRKMLSFKMRKLRFLKPVITNDYRGFIEELLKNAGNFEIGESSKKIVRELGVPI